MIEKIAYYIGRNDEEPNIELAILLCNTKDTQGIKEIVKGLKHEKQQVVNDCIKVLYEIGEREPELIAEYVLDFIQLLKSKNNRLVWGSMTALSKIIYLKPKEVFENINTVINAYEKGSVITVDNAISVFAELCKAGQIYEETIFKYILKHLETCRPKEVGQHSERAYICINKSNSEEFLHVLLKRRECLIDSQKKRVDKLIRKIEKCQYCS